MTSWKNNTEQRSNRTMRTERSNRRPASKHANRSVEAKGPVGGLDIDPDDVPAPGMHVTPKQIRKMREYRQLGLSYDEIAKFMAQAKATVFHYSKDVVVSPDISAEEKQPASEIPQDPSTQAQILPDPVTGSYETGTVSDENTVRNVTAQTQSGSQLLEISIDPKVTLACAGDAMNRGYMNLNDYFHKYVFPSLRKFQILKDSVVFRDDDDFLTNVQLLLGDGLKWRRMMMRMNNDQDAKTVQELGGDPEVWKMLTRFAG